ncbi:hypothetical protein RDI58_007077 [Solanum bulbocastanum]|uniref:Uncharacterized protein n=1 Tax=Solanum bulbocastanum TaxID=147425 RepID=A0AAN8TVU8_SOLBU
MKYLKHDDTFKVFVGHVLDKTLLDTEGFTSYLTNGNINGGEVVDLGRESVDVNLGGESEVVNLGGESVYVNLGGKGDTVNLGGESVDANLGEEDLGDIPSEDRSYIDEELRALKQERRNKKQRKKATKYKEIPDQEAGGIDKGFEDIEKNKTNKHVGKLKRDEEYLDNSDG